MAPIIIEGIPIPSSNPLFLAVLAIHVPAGLVSAVAGVAAMLSKKKAGRHPSAGTIYYWALAVLFATSSVLAILRWTADFHLFLFGLAAFAAASFGRTARRRHWSGWPRLHVAGMGTSYILLLTAFYVDNGP